MSSSWIIYLDSKTAMNSDLQKAILKQPNIGKMKPGG